MGPEFSTEVRPVPGPAGRHRDRTGLAPQHSIRQRQFDEPGSTVPLGQQEPGTWSRLGAFEAVVRRIRRSGPTDPAAPVGRRRDSDAEEAAHQEAEPGAPSPAPLTSPSSGIPEAAAGETVYLPDMETPPSPELIDADAVAGTIDYSPTVTRSGTVRPFGSTTWSKFKLTGISVTAAPSTFTTRFTLENPITFNVASPKKSIASKDDPQLTNTNYPKAASDLTPNMSVQGGRPPRTEFWAEDLTVRHEHFHAEERKGFHQAGARQSQAWLSAQTADSVAAVQALIRQVPNRVIRASTAAAGTVDEKESRAYGDGAAGYLARANAITAKGALGPASGGYP